MGDGHRTCSVVGSFANRPPRDSSSNRRNPPFLTDSKEPKIRARARSTEEMIKQAMENTKRERARKEAVEKGEGSELEHFQVKI